MSQEQAASEVSDINKLINSDFRKFLMTPASSFPNDPVNQNEGRSYAKLNVKASQKSKDLYDQRQKRKSFFVELKKKEDDKVVCATLTQIINRTSHDNSFKENDLLSMSNLKTIIQDYDSSSQILYNLAMANLGLCAFRHANINDAHNCLVDLMVTGGKPRELLLQGLLIQEPHKCNRTQENNEDQKNNEKPCQYMNINFELLECIYLVSAMLIEIPLMAENQFSGQHRRISKTFYQQIRNVDKQVLVGPPGSMREHVAAAAKALRNGNWAACQRFIINEKMNAKVWDFFHNADDIRIMLTRLIQEESLRIYLLIYSNAYDSISMTTLANMFELEYTKVRTIICKMINNQELTANLDAPTQIIVVHKFGLSRLQSLAFQLTEKLNKLVDQKEQMLKQTIKNDTKKHEDEKTPRRKQKRLNIRHDN